jgi:hypothetical protein
VPADEILGRVEIRGHPGRVVGRRLRLLEQTLLNQLPTHDPQGVPARGRGVQGGQGGPVPRGRKRLMLATDARHHG